MSKICTTFTCVTAEVSSLTRLTNDAFKTPVLGRNDLRLRCHDFSALAVRVSKTDNVMHFARLTRTSKCVQGFATYLSMELTHGVIRILMFME